MKNNLTPWPDMPNLKLKTIAEMESERMKTIKYFYRGDVERGTGKGYAWRQGYNETSEDGQVLYPWMTVRECQAEAKSRGCRAEFITNNQQPE